MSEIILFGCIIILLYFLGTVDAEKKSFKATVIYVAIVTIIIIMLYLNGEDYYKRGQIDVINGKVKYELKAQPDSTRIWVKKEPLK